MNSSSFLVIIPILVEGTGLSSHGRRTTDPRSFFVPPLLNDPRRSARLAYSYVSQSARFIGVCVAAIHRINTNDRSAGYSSWCAVYRSPFLLCPHDRCALNLPLFAGYCPGLIYEAYSRCILKAYPTLQLNNISPLPEQIVNSVKKETVRFGVVSESVGNSSPGLCLQEIFQLMAASDWPIDFIFFTRPAMNTVFASTMVALAHESYTLDEGSIEKSVHIIREVARPDILLYLALPTERFTVTLAHYRLAPIQIQYGLGHPLSSGVMNTVDYSILSRTMLIADANLRTSGERLGDAATDVVRACAYGASECRNLGFLESGDISMCSEVLHPSCMSRGHETLYYTEQVVLFEELGFHIQDFSLLYFSSVADVLQIESIEHCGAVTDLLKRLSVGLTAHDIGCGGQQPRVHLYSCIQHSKKMHPEFDRALLGIINRDPKAVIILNQGPRDVLLTRWTKNWGVSFDNILDRFIFTDRIEHPDYLRLLSYTTVFLNPFPFGSGITSSDAISVCVPIVLFPEAISVLPFALAQVRALGPMFEDLFIVHSVTEYVERAVTIASKAHSAVGRQLRRDICSTKNRLYGEDSIAASAKEWAQFLVTTAKRNGLIST